MNEKVINIILFASKWYSQKKFVHAMRVAAFAAKIAKETFGFESPNAFIIGLAHDLIEDTEAPVEELEAIIGEDLMSSVWILTKCDDVTYQEYIDEIVSSKDQYAIIVKRSDIKDHLIESSEPSEKNQKYLAALATLL